MSDEDYQYLLRFIKENTGVDLNRFDEISKEKRVNGVRKILDSLGSEFRDIESLSKKDKSAIINECTNNETAFFRDRLVFDVLKDILQKLPNNEPIKVLSCPSSTGQEAYSLAILLDELGISKYQITGNDIDSSAVEYAKNGKYNRFEIMRGLSDEQLKKYFLSSEKKEYQVSDDLKKNINFSTSSIEDLLEIKYDIVLCRNLLFYFDDNYKEIIAKKIMKLLKPDGVLILGSTEFLKTKGLEETSFKGIRTYRLTQDKP